MSSDSSAAKDAAIDPSAVEPLLDSSEELNNVHYPADNSTSAGGGFRTINTASYSVVEQKQAKPQQKLVLVCHFAFKTLALFIYLFANFVHLGFITTFVFVLLLLSVDFWVVKNLSGRLLAGLRWWSHTDPDSGKMAWKFEAWTPEERQIAFKSQMNLFWVGIMAQQFVWSLLFFASMFGLNFGWLVITVISCSLNSANLYGYVRCRLQQPSEFQKSIMRRTMDSVIDMVRSTFTSSSTSRGGYTQAEVVDGGY